MKRILVVHHDTNFLDQMASSLSQAGFEVLTTKDIAAAIARLGESSLLVLDISSQGYSLEDLSLLHQLSSSPLIAVGNYPSRKVLGQAVEAGADSYLEEKMSPTEFVARVKAIIPRHFSEFEGASPHQRKKGGDLG
jgi:DNA-binding response OmpR family regulator